MKLRQRGHISAACYEHEGKNHYKGMPLSYEWNPCPVSLLGIRNWGFGIGTESLQGNKSASQLKEYHPSP